MADQRILDDEFTRAGPPRNLDLFSKAVVLFGGFSIQFGLLFFGFGMIFFWVFAMNSTMVTAFQKGGEWLDARGIVEESESTNSSINEQTVHRIKYAYKVGPNNYKGKSYSHRHYYSTGSEVEVEYKSNNPDRSRIKETQEKIFPFFAGLATMIFPFVGLMFMLGGFTKNLKFLRLLKIGHFTRGKLLSKNQTTTKINDSYVYAYEFSFQANDRSYISKCRTHITHAVEDEKEEIILYDSGDPERSIVYDAMPASLGIDEEGNISSARPDRIWVLVLPAIVFFGHGIYYFLRYLI